MKKINLLKLKLSNFMKFREFTFAPDGNNCIITGANRAGKTTIASAFSFLLFGKDIYGNSVDSFSIKTRDGSGRIIPMLDHTVEGVLSINETPLTLKRTYRETWSKKNRKLTGHTTDYWIDQEPVKKKEYETGIEGIISFDLFRLLTSVTIFIDLPWKIRREQLFKVCADAKEDTLREAEKAKKIILSKKQVIESRKKFIPARVDELNQSLKTVSDLDKTEIAAKIAKLEKQIETVKTDKGRTVLLKEIVGLEGQLIKLKEKQNTAWQKIASEIEKLEDDLCRIKRTIRDIEFEINIQNNNIISAEEDLQQLFLEWESLENPEIDSNCPACGQPLPESQIEEARQAFNLKRAEKLEQLDKQSRAAKTEKINAEKKISKLTKNLETEKANFAKIEKKLKILKERPPGKSKEAEAIQAKIDDLAARLKNNDSEINISSLESALSEERVKMAKIDAAKETKERIRSLLEEEKDMAIAIEKLEADLFYSEQKIETEARKVEESINSLFKNDCIDIRFQLFKEHLNASIEPCCKTLINNVEYGHGTSTSEEIRAGLAIIQVLSDFYGIYPPVFVDRMESISDPLPEMTNQVIRLAVDENIKDLEIKKTE